MGRDRMIGFVILIASIVGIVVYGFLLYTYPIAVLQMTIFVAVAGVLAIVAWIGWTMASTPSQPVRTEQPNTGTGSQGKEVKFNEQEPTERVVDRVST